ncbi:Coiled-coil domain-containing protein 178 [Sciurus carolinensis]|uniref:Coiled-coil domain-containing protein 178 n=1 Tax=Sciurus carolinensis TaxID=30640 RepID=A0AA41N1X8_SCICA|nr:Coiled-coil domain-containing protein 178 [Sciurus carolinensis]
MPENENISSCPTEDNQTKIDEKCSELKKEMQTLLSEAIHLIKCLETDRAIAEETLNQQKLRKGRITTKIDAWSIWKLQELPIAVQKEHDAYLRDIIELQWHLESRTHQLEHVEKQKTKLEEANAKIQTDMDYMLQHGPLLQSKRRQELQVIKERYQKKAEVVEQYRQVHEQLEELKDAFENSKLRVKEAKERMDKDISLDEASIEKYKRELDRLNNLFNRYSLSIKSASAHIEEKQEAMSEALKETESSSSELSALSKTCLKKSNYQQHYLEVLNKFYVTKSSWDTELSNVAKDFSDVSIAHTQGTEENERLLLDLENMTKEINDREDFLKRRIRSQIAAGMMIQKKIYSVQDDQMNEKKELLRQKAVYALALQEIQEPLLRLESDAVHLETLHQEQYNLLNDIIERREFVRKKVEKTKKKLRRKGKKAREALIETGEKRSAVFQELESTKGKTYAFNVKISELKIELKEQEDENVAFEKKIEQLKENFLVVRFKRENAQSIFDHFMDKKKDCEERIFEEDQKFTMLFNTRQKTLKDIKVSIIFDYLK